MTAARASAAATRLFLSLLPLLVLLATLTATCLVWQHERESSNKALRSQFDFALRETVSRIEQRVLGYEQMLRGVQSLFATTALGNRAAMHDYVEALQLDANFSGIQAIGAVRWVSAGQEAAHVAAMRAQGFTQYAIDPAGLREAYAPIIQREPYVGRNIAPLGVDVWPEPVRRAAMERARDSGMAAISGKVQLKVDAKGDAPASFIMYLPVFAPGLPHSNASERRAHLIGWVYAAFHMSDFMASLYGTQFPGLALTLHDDTETSDAALMYQSELTDAGRAAALSATEYMVLAGHTWTLGLQTQSAFEERYGRGAAFIIAVTGTSLSCLLAFLVWVMVGGRARALRMAEAMTEELRHMAQHDPLTNLPNRALFSDRLNQELAHALRHEESFAMVFLDLDNFKPINDNFGHAVGDQVLRHVARRLQSCIRAEDTVGRIGGDEFVLLLAGMGALEAIVHLTEKIRESLRQPLVVDGHSLVVSCSMGVAVYPEDGLDAIALTKSADEAMYRAKAEGRNCVRMGGSAA